MRPPHQARRIGLVISCGAAIAIGVSLLLSALNENTQFFYNPSDVAAADFEPDSTEFRIGGLVAEGSVEKSGDLKTTFRIEDFERDMRIPITVSHVGVLNKYFVKLW